MTYVEGIEEFHEKLKPFPNPFVWVIPDYAMKRVKVSLDEWEEKGSSRTDLALENFKGFLCVRLDSDREAARKCFLNVLSHDPKNIVAKACLGKLAIDERKEAEVKKWVAELEELQSDDLAMCQAKCEEAFITARLGHMFTGPARDCFRKLYKDTLGHTEVVSEIALLDLRALEEKFEKKLECEESEIMAMLEVIMKHLRNVYALVEKPDSIVFGRFIHLHEVAMTTAAGRKWLRKQEEREEDWHTPEFYYQRGKLLLLGDRRDLYLYTNMIRYFRKSGDPKRALDVLEHAIKKIPEEYRLLYQHGKVALDASRKKVTLDKEAKSKAEANLLHAARLRPVNPNIHGVLGQFYVEVMHELAKGQQHFQTAIILLEEKKEIYAVIREHQYWCKSLALAKELDPCVKQMYTALDMSKTLQSTRAAKSLSELFRQLREDDPDDTFYLLCSGYLSLHIGKTDEALIHFQKADKFEQTLWTCIGLTESYLAKKTYFEAESWLEKARSYGNESADVKIQELQDKLDELR